MVSAPGTCPVLQDHSPPQPPAPRFLFPEPSAHRFWTAGPGAAVPSHPGRGNGLCPRRHCRPGHSRFLFTSRPALGMGAWRRSPGPPRAAVLGLREGGGPGLPWPFPHVTPHQHAWGLPRPLWARAHALHTPDFPFLTLDRCQTPGLSAGPRHPRSCSAAPRTDPGVSPTVAPLGSAAPGLRAHPRLLASPRTELLALSTSTGRRGRSLSTPNPRRPSPAAFRLPFLPAPGFPAPESPARPPPASRPIGPRPFGPAGSAKLERAPVLAPLGSHPTAPGCLRGPAAPDPLFRGRCRVLRPHR